jgi:cytochrome c553
MNRHLLAAVVLAMSPYAFAEHGAEHDPYTGGSVEAGATKAAVCGACHGPGGNGAINPEWPKLAGQSGAFIVKQLKAFKSGQRKNPVMLGQVANLSDADMADLGAFFAAQKPVPGLGSKDSIAVAEKLYRAGDATRSLPACGACHGPTGAGVEGAKYPQIGGQNSRYIEAQLKAYRSGERTTGPMMLGIANKLSDAEIAALSSYLAGLQ